MQQEYRLLYADWDGAVAATDHESKLRALLEEYVGQGDNVFELVLYEGEDEQEQQVGWGLYEVSGLGIEILEEETGKLKGIMQRVFGEDVHKPWVIGPPPMERD